MIEVVKKELRKYAHRERVSGVCRFFKTGKGEYGEGDKFFGIYVPDIRKTATKFKELDLENIKILLDSDIHEERLLGLFILVKQFPNNEERIYKFYINNIKAVNNWDLVDLTADKIVGKYLFDKNKKILYKFAVSKNLWKRRIAIISTFYFIKKNKFKHSLKISNILLDDKHDLIHKAVGWMLREIGKRDQETEEKFLKKHLKQMPRTMLRYAIERFDKEKRCFFMKK
ncbi:DNA alkylation repair protein [Candidatus Woesearchaeota archaeon]|jgi:3-methyladenine DNA glycosylase AlkD|nr:DNA alkylation repair protein [Candidatus Woesearchaeota archaeon]|tara:strand:+ start:457 stop:1140 length:684 start_codon:yes stop_codon:yes gene_type:complete